MIIEYPAPPYLMGLKIIGVDLEKDTAYYIHTTGVRVEATTYGGLHWVARMKELGIEPLVDPDLMVDEGL